VIFFVAQDVFPLI